MIGQVISHYKIIEKLGEGGMGIVYKAHDTMLDRTVALKFLPSHLTKSEGDKERFIREAKAAAALNHPHICTIHNVDKHDSNQFIVMEYIDGVTLREKLEIGDSAYAPKSGASADKQTSASGKPGTWNLGLGTAVDYALQIAEALTEAHDKGIVHRDIKPENIMVDSKNRIKVMDFGLAKLKGTGNLTKSGSTIGTMAYMSPEQIQGQEVDHRSDIFSFGVILYEMITGTTPFRGEHEAAILYSIVNEDPEPVTKYNKDVYPELVRLINCALEKKPEERYQSLEAVIDDLRQLQGRPSTHSSTGSSVSVDAEHRSQQQQTKTQSSSLSINIPGLKTPAGIIGILAATIVIGVLFYFIFSSPTAVVDEVDRQSIAVLPLENLSPNPDDAYFADGIHDDIIIQLSQIGGIHTIARSSVMRYIPEDRNLQQIADELNVTAVLEGNVRRAGDVIRVAVQLVDTRSNETLWADSYERSDITELFEIQRAISSEITSALQVTLTPVEEKLLDEHPTEIAEAYELYLRGRAHFTRTAFGEVDLRSIEDLMIRALEYDPDFANANALLSRSYSMIKWSGFDTSPRVLELSHRYAERALTINPDLPEAHIAMGYYYYYGHRNYEEALEYFNTARRMQPNNAEIISSIAFVERRLGRFDDAVETLNTAISLDPMNSSLYYEQGLLYLLLREYEKAQSIIAMSIYLSPENSAANFLAVYANFLREGDTDAIRNFTENNSHLKGEQPIQWLWHQYLIRDYDGMIQSVNDIDEDIYFYQFIMLPSAYFLGLAYEHLDKHDQAIHYYKMALSRMEELYTEHHDEARYRSSLGLIYVALELEEEAIAEGKKAIDLMPLSLDAIDGGHHKLDLAVIYARLQKTEDAVRILRELLSIPSMVSVYRLEFDPIWDFIRDTPEFQTLINEFKESV